MMKAKFRLRLVTLKEDTPLWGQHGNFLFI
jgi:hypothetical protein